MRIDRCFAFVDLSGFTSFADHEGDDRAIEVLAQLRAVLREISARRGVRVVKWLGDGAMLSSTAIDSLVAAVLELRCRMSDRGALLPIRAGVSSGPVIMFEGDDYIGRPVNVAARLTGAAGAAQILATTEILRELPPWVTAVEDRPRVLRGFDDPVPVVRLDVADPGDDPVMDPVCGLVIPRSAAIPLPGAEAGDAVDTAVLFCSDACASSWPAVLGR